MLASIFVQNKPQRLYFHHVSLEIFVDMFMNLDNSSSYIKSKIFHAVVISLISILYRYNCQDNSILLKKTLILQIFQDSIHNSQVPSWDLKYDPFKGKASG